MLRMLGKSSLENILTYISYFPLKIAFDVSCKYFHIDNLHEITSSIFREFTLSEFIQSSPPKAVKWIVAAIMFHTVQNTAAIFKGI